jgi:UV DNA damage endonuclease
VSAIQDNNIQLGYACINLTLKTKFKDVTLKTLEQLDLSKRIEKLNSIALNNTSLVDQIINFNNQNNIGLYRIPTNLLAFPTHPISNGWNWRRIIQPCFKFSGELANELKIRISFHADEYTIINTPHQTVFENSMKSLIYLADIIDMMDVHGNIVVHVGGVYCNKKESMQRFITNFHKLPEHVKVKIILENDDKQYSWIDTYIICEKLNIPMVLDIHHYKILTPNSSLKTEEISRIFSTWNGKKPKIHLSSARSEKESRAHADYVNINDYLWFYEAAKGFNYDIMCEAKAKELAVLKFKQDMAD